MADDPSMTDRPSDAPEDPAVVRVTTSGVRGRPSARPPAGRGPLLAAVALVTAVVLGGLALRNAPAQTAQSTPGLDGSATVGAIGNGAAELSATEPGPTLIESPDATVLPSLEPTAVATSSPTKKPPKATPRPEPTDSQYTEWTPPPGFVGTVTISDYCSHANGTEEVLVEADFNSPVKVANIAFYLDGFWFAWGGPPVGQELIGTVIVGHDLDVGTTHVVEARFVHGPLLVDLIAKRESDPFLVPQGPPCPGG